MESTPLSFAKIHGNSQIIRKLNHCRVMIVYILKCYDYFFLNWISKIRIIPLVGLGLEVFLLFSSFKMLVVEETKPGRKVCKDNLKPESSSGENIINFYVLLNSR